MRKILFIILILFLLATFSIANAESTSLDPLTLGLGARSIGMGRTGVANPGDINAIFENPANGTSLNSWGLTSMYTSLLEGDMNYTFVGGATNSKYGTFGLACLKGLSEGIGTTTRDANGRIAFTGNSIDYSNMTVVMSYSKDIQPNLSTGASLKYFNKNFGSQASGSGMDADVGMLYSMVDKFVLGVVLKDILPKGIGGLTWNTGTSEDTPMDVKGGFKYKINNNLILNSDVSIAPFDLNVGAEWNVSPNISFRGGVEQLSTGTSSQTNMTLGVGFKVSGFNFDYSYFKDGAIDSNSTHFFSFSYVPELPKPKVMEQKAIESSEEVKYLEISTPEVQMSMVLPVKVNPVKEMKSHLKQNDKKVLSKTKIKSKSIKKHVKSKSVKKYHIKKTNKKSKIF